MTRRRSPLVSLLAGLLVLGMAPPIATADTRPAIGSSPQGQVSTACAISTVASGLGTLRAAVCPRGVPLPAEFRQTKVAPQDGQAASGDGTPMLLGTGYFTYSCGSGITCYSHG